MSGSVGHLDKMAVELRADGTVAYHLRLDGQRLPLDGRLGQPLTLAYQGAIHCRHCGRATKKSFQQGFCYPCSRKLARCDICIVRPEKCHYDQGTCREPAWADAHCMQPHIVYLANSSGLKVGITRQEQVPTRWIDQGATQALPVMRVASRHVSGLAEVALATHVADKTNWQRMLKGVPQPVDLVAARDRLLADCETDIAVLRDLFGEPAVELLDDAAVQSIDYPVSRYPAKVKALNFDKDPLVSGVLQGIKGQYLILDSGVLNVRKFTGYQVAVTLGD